MSWSRRWNLNLTDIKTSSTLNLTECFSSASFFSSSFLWKSDNFYFNEMLHSTSAATAPCRILTAFLTCLMQLSDDTALRYSDTRWAGDNLMRYTGFLLWCCEDIRHDCKITDTGLQLITFRQRQGTFSPLIQRLKWIPCDSRMSFSTLTGRFDPPQTVSGFLRKAQSHCSIFHLSHNECSQLWSVVVYSCPAHTHHTPHTRRTPEPFVIVISYN